MLIQYDFIDLVTFAKAFFPNKVTFTGSGEHKLGAGEAGLRYFTQCDAHLRGCHLSG